LLPQLKIKEVADHATLLHQLQPLRDYTKSKRDRWLNSLPSNLSIVHQTVHTEITDAMEATWNIALITIKVTKLNPCQLTLTLQSSKLANIINLLVW
jgi:hypothetical protein